MMGFEEFLLTNALSAAVLALGVLIVELFIRSPQVRHFLWVVILLRLLAPPMVEVPLWTETSEPLLRVLSISESVLEISPGTTSLPKEVSLGWASTSRTRGVLWMIWCLGASVVFFTAFLRLGNLFRKISERSGTSGPRIPESLGLKVNSLANRMGISRPPPAILVDRTLPPMLLTVLGWRRLVLSVPILERLTENEASTVIAHELAHLKRKDDLIRHLELVALILFWWHPVAWGAVHRLRRAEERCCDNVVRRTLPGCGRTYADGILKTVNGLATGTSPALVSGLGAKNDLKGRLTMILTEPLPSPLPKTLKTVLLAFCLAALILTPSGAKPSSSDEAAVDLRETPKAPTLDLGEVLGQIARQGNLKVMIDANVDQRLPAILPSPNLPWKQRLQEVLRSHDLDVNYLGDLMLVTRGDLAAKVNGPYKGVAIDFEARDIELREAILRFNQWSEVEIIVDEEVQGQVTIVSQDIPWDQLFDQILRINGLRWSRFDDRLFISPVKQIHPEG